MYLGLSGSHEHAETPPRQAQLAIADAQLTSSKVDSMKNEAKEQISALLKKLDGAVDHARRFPG